MNVEELRRREAIAAAERGWVLTPLEGKKPKLKNWTQLPAPEPSTVEEWCKQGNLGLRTGATSGVVVIDDDTQDGSGIVGLLGERPVTPTVITGGGGRHYYFRAPEPCPRNSAGKLAPHVDVRSEGGQVVYPGSIHPDTRDIYRWAEGLSPDDITLAELPPEVLERLRARSESSSPMQEPATSTPSGPSGLSKYARTALEQEVEAVRQSQVGTRNDALNRAAFSLGQLVAGGVIPRATVEGALTEGAREAGLDDSEIASTIRSGMEGGATSPRSDGSPPGQKPGNPRRSFHRTDLGSADRFIQDHAQNLRFVHGWKKWFVWKGGYWRCDDTNEVQRLAQRTVSKIWREAAALQDESERKPLFKHAAKSEDKNRLQAMVTLATADRSVAITHEVLDRHPHLLTVKNGTLDLRTGKLDPHRRDDLITKRIPLAYDAKAECPQWMAFLDRVFGGDGDLIQYVQLAVGYTLTGSIREQVFFVLHGTGSNGKSTLIETLRAMMGDYAKHTPFDTFLIKKNDAIPNDVARLCGARLVTACEADAGKRLSESLIKSLTGGDTITARFMRREFFEFSPEFKIWLSTNHKPAIWGVDHAIWRRIKLIPFNVTIPDDQQDKNLPRKLRSELPGILAWAVEGCRRWVETGLDEATAVAVATHQYRRDEDVLSDFIEEQCVIGPRVQVKVAELYRTYAKWAEENGGPALSKKRFGTYLGERPEGLSSGRVCGNRVWRGIGLRQPGGEP